MQEPGQDLPLVQQFELLWSWTGDRQDHIGSPVKLSCGVDNLGSGISETFVVEPAALTGLAFHVAAVPVLCQDPHSNRG